ncbi:hypothetical protein TWF730_006623 [Orbilia blumenaviensis]|uniref:F-box domain-containing protein n=1 Tax=Orbilia blumenaviensis TaxID=1796055 RepID=A0AAV9VES8_9PEZI
MPGILDCPSEVLDLIVDAVALSPALDSEVDVADPPHQRSSRRILPLGKTCRFLYRRFFLPRFYSNCFLEFHNLSNPYENEGPRYRLFEFSAQGTVQKYNGFLEHGTFVKNLNVRFDDRRSDWMPTGQDWTNEEWSEYQDIPQPAPAVLDNLIPRFDHLRRVEFQRSVRSPGSLGDFVQGLGLVLSRVTTLTALDLSVQYNDRDKSDWIQSGIDLPYSSFIAPLQELSISLDPMLRDLGWDDHLTEADVLSCFWFMDVLANVLELPSRTVKALNFEFIMEEFEDSAFGLLWLNGGDPLAGIGDPRKLLVFPVVEKLYLTPGSGCQLVFERYFVVIHRGIKELGLQLISLSEESWGRVCIIHPAGPSLISKCLDILRD